MKPPISYRKKPEDQSSVPLEEDNMVHARRNINGNGGWEIGGDESGPARWAPSAPTPPPPAYRNGALHPPASAPLQAAFIAGGEDSGGDWEELITYSTRAYVSERRRLGGMARRTFHVLRRQRPAASLRLIDLKRLSLCLAPYAGCCRRLHLLFGRALTFPCVLKRLPIAPAVPLPDHWRNYWSMLPAADLCPEPIHGTPQQTTLDLHRLHLTLH
ncbi:hypothetical protein BHM03_00055821 [Ensete ventricosum]|nr:hypothetical protein BHM03_00055821 [Ensete ventricosum]